MHTHSLTHAYTQTKKHKKSINSGSCQITPLLFRYDDSSPSSASRNRARLAAGAMSEALPSVLPLRVLGAGSDVLPAGFVGALVTTEAVFAAFLGSSFAGVSVLPFRDCVLPASSCGSKDSKKLRTSWNPYPLIKSVLTSTSLDSRF